MTVLFEDTLTIDGKRCESLELPANTIVYVECADSWEPLADLVDRVQADRRTRATTDKQRLRWLLFLLAAATIATLVWRCQ